jgi:hypothetical protein
MKAALTVSRQNVGADHIVFTRSDGAVFHLRWLENGYASLFHEDEPPPYGINLDVSIADKPARAEKLILAYPNW